MNKSFNITIQKLQETTAYIKSKTSVKPKIGLVLGSGLGTFAREIKADVILPYADIPNFLPPTVEGHQGNLIIGHVGQQPVAALQGRVHFYEGHSMEEVVFPTRALAMLGAQYMVLTNSAGGLGDGMQAGDFMVINDHLNLMGVNPLMGPNIKELGPRFPDMTEAYDKKFVSLWEETMKSLGLRYHLGTYGGLSGPTYETPAEVRYLKMIGCSAVGMSTVPETIAANHLGLRVAAVSVISNLGAGIAKHKLSHQEVTETATRVEKDFSAALSKFILALP